MAKLRTHYDNLKIVRNAPASVIKAAYKALCQTYHPDKFQGSKEEAERIMKIVNASYEILIDPVKREIHDRWIDEQEAKEQQHFEENEPHNDTSENNYNSLKEDTDNYWLWFSSIMILMWALVLYKVGFWG